ncbi:MAG: hypothetical protein ACPGFC_10130 [Paracoccaceae bacterium]
MQQNLRHLILPKTLARVSTKVNSVRGALSLGPVIFYKRCESMP